MGITPEQLAAAADWSRPVGARERGPTQEQVNAYRAANKAPMYSRESPIAPGRLEPLAPNTPAGQAREPGTGRFSAVSHPGNSLWPVIGRNQPTAAEKVRADLKVVETPPAARQVWHDMRTQCFTPVEELVVKRQIEHCLSSYPAMPEADLRQSAVWALASLREGYPKELGPPPVPPPAVPAPPPAEAPTPRERAAEIGIAASSPAPAPVAPVAPQPIPFSEWVKSQPAVRRKERDHMNYLKSQGLE